MGRAQFSALTVLGKFYETPEADLWSHSDPGSNNWDTVFDKLVDGKLDYLWVYTTTTGAATILTVRITTTSGGVETVNVALNHLQGKYVFRAEVGLTSGTTRSAHGTHESIAFEVCKVEVRAAPPNVHQTAIQVRHATAELN